MHPYRSSYHSHSPATPLTSSITSPHDNQRHHHSPYGFPPPPINMNVGMNQDNHHGNIGHSHSHSRIHTNTTARHASTGSSRTNHPDYSESESDGEDDKVEKDKLEIRREKNRVKQRNLRLRRANHIADLERNLTNIRTDHTSLQASFAHLQQREQNLQGWVHDLESALFRNGMAAEVETLRRIWADRDSSSQLPQQRPTSSHQHGLLPPQNPQQLPTPSTSSTADPLSTLAKAASAIPLGPGTCTGPAYTEGRMSYPLPSTSSGVRPTLPRVSSFSRPFENPYPTPEIGWGSQMNEWVQGPSSLETDKKRKRDPYTTDFPPPPPSRPGMHSMTGRLSESNVHTLPPIQSYRQTSPSSARPTSAPYQSQFRQSISVTTSASASISTTGTGNVSPRSIRISDLVSPRPSQIDHVLPSLSTSISGSEFGSSTILDSKRQLEMITSREGGWNRSNSKGDLSVTGQGSETDEWNETPPFEILQSERRISGVQPNQSQFDYRFSQAGETFLTPEGRITENKSIIIPQSDWQDPFTVIASQGSSNTGRTDTQISVDVGQQDDDEGDVTITDLTPHASVYTARILLLSILPQPILLDYPPVLPDLFKEQQRIVLTALTNLYPPEMNEKFRSKQLKGLSNEDAKLLLEYQSSSKSDLRLTLFPIALLRAAVIRVMRSNPDTFSLTSFISSTLREARVFGNPLDPDAWEMSESFWDQWGRWFPSGRGYCNSISEWRRRDGHVGSGVVEMILGLQGEKDRRREDWVGKPPGWKMPRAE